MRRAPIMAFHGFSRSGKDTAVDAIVSHVREKLGSFAPGRTIQYVEKQSFSAGLKDTTETAFGAYGLMPWRFYDKEENQHLRDVPLSCGLTPTQLWIAMGKALREIYLPVVADSAFHTLPALTFNVFTSLRFTDEGEAIHKRGGWCVKVLREGTVPLALDKKMDPDFKWDAVLINDCSIEDFRKRAIDVAELYLKEYQDKE